MKPHGYLISQYAFASTNAVAYELRAVQDLRQQVETLTHRVERRDEAIRSLHRRLAIELERALHARAEDLEAVRHRAGKDHAKFKAQVERNEQLAFDFNEKLRGLEYEKKSSVVILAAKDRIIERSQQEMVSLEERLFNEKKRADKLLADVKRAEHQREEDLAQLAALRAEGGQARRELEALQARHSALCGRFEALSAELLQEFLLRAEGRCCARSWLV